MKRTISILVIVAMMLASLLAIIPASAAEPEGTAITNKAEFAAMDPAGKYYLANDIKLTETYGQDFKGVLDGNGHTITLSGAISVFNKVAEAEISNLNIVASFSSATSFDYGALAKTANGVFDNIHATVDVAFTVMVRNSVGGIFGQVDGASMISNCSAEGSVAFQYLEATKDNGDVGFCLGGLIGKAFACGALAISDCKTDVTVYSRQIRSSVGGVIGGIAGSSQVTIENTVNYGNVTGRSGDHSGVGGFVGAFNANSVTTATLEIKTSRNYGNVASEGEGTIDCHIGGFVGRGYGPKLMTIDGCVNSGNVTSVGGGWACAGGIIGGVMTYGYSWSSNPDCVITVKNSMNVGTISGGSFCGGITGGALQFNGDNCNFVVANCANYGDVTGGSAGGALGRGGENGFAGLDIDNFYNSGAIKGSSAAGGVVGALNPQDNSADKLTDNRLPMTIDNAANEGAVTGGSGICGAVTVEGFKITITGAANTGEAVNALAPEGAEYVIVDPAEDAAAKIAEILAVVPASSASLDEVLIPANDCYADDYKSGWDDFAAARDAANLVANSAQTADKIAEVADALKTAMAALVAIDSIDRAPLTKALEAAAEFELWEEDYTPGSWEEFAKALAAAKALGDDAKQSAINMASAALNKAIEGLAKKPNFAPLDAELAKYVDYVETDYTSASWAAFAAARDAATALKDDPNATNVDVQEKIEALMFAALGLENRTSVAPLEAKVNSVLADYPSANYTPDSYDPLLAALRVAQSAISTGDVSAAGIKKITKSIDDAIALLIKRGDVTELKAAVADFEAAFTEDLFTVDSWAAFKVEFDEVKKMVGPAQAAKLTRADVEALTKKFEAALELLVPGADYTEADALIAEINALTADDYSAETWTAVQDIITAITAVKGTPVAQDVVDDLVKSLKLAKNALVKVEKPTETQAPTEAPAATEAPKAEGGCGGSVVATVAVVAVVSTLGVAVLRKKED